MTLAEPVPLLSARQVGRKLDSGWIWQNLSFDVFAGDRIAIIGASGTGKSLLLRTIAGLDDLQAGQLLYQGQSLSTLAMPQYRSQVMYLHQRPALREGTVEFNLQQVYQLAIHGQRTYSRSYVLQQLAAFERGADFLNRSVESLSGGEAQLVACLRSLQLAPHILLLDEPTASMDETTAQQLEALITQWQQSEPGRACLWTSHNATQLQRVTDRAVALREKGT